MGLVAVGAIGMALGLIGLLTTLDQRKRRRRVRVRRSPYGLLAVATAVAIAAGAALVGTALLPQ